MVGIEAIMVPRLKETMSREATTTTGNISMAESSQPDLQNIIIG